VRDVISPTHANAIKIQGIAPMASILQGEM
jgi:hypothetical protein